MSNTCCSIPVTIPADENFSLVDENGWPFISIYRRPGGELEVFFEQMEEGLALDEAKEIALAGMRHWKVKSLSEQPSPVEVIAGSNGLQFTRTPTW